jgi:competence protein ComGC
MKHANGQSLVEILLILMLVAVIVFLVISLLGPTLEDIYSGVINQVLITPSPTP